MGKKAKGRKKARSKSGPQVSRSMTGAAGETQGALGEARGAPIGDLAKRPDDRRPASATELAARLAGLSTLLQRNLGRSDEGDGLTRARLSALALLVLGGPKRLGELAAAERVRPPTMTRLVRAMEADGLVVRERSTTDGRSIIIHATSRGERALERGRARRIVPLAKGITELEDDERLRLEDATDLLGRVMRSAAWEREPRE